MAQVSSKATFNTSAETIWKSISDFGGIGKFMPMITDAKVRGAGTGATRTLTIQGGGQVFERLERLDAQAKVVQYSILSSPLPVDGYVATMTVRSLGANQCELQWSSTFAPKAVTQAEAQKVIEGIYAAGFEGLRKLHKA